MIVGPSVALAALAYLIIKHFVCDFVLQSDYQVQKKGIYGHPGGLLHSSIHVLGTLPVLLILAPTLLIAAAIIIGEWLLHYHCDWAKEQILRRFGWTAVDRGYWSALGADQMLHYLSYVGMIMILS